MISEQWQCAEVVVERHGAIACLSVNRPGALNALSLPMIRALTAALLAWRDDPGVAGVALRGMGKSGPFGAFCAGGDIRHFHHALLHGDPAVEDFFDEEYTLNHLIATYPKPTVAFIDGVCMGGGMGLAQGCQLRVVTERSQLAMPETLIGLFPDVGGGYFLSRCPGHLGEWLALTGTPLAAGDALAVGWADVAVPADRLPRLWASLADIRPGTVWDMEAWVASEKIAVPADRTRAIAQIDAYFGAPSALAVVHALEAAPTDDWAVATAAALRQRSPLMLEVTLQQVRRARHLTLAQALRQERDLMRHVFAPRHLHRHGPQTEAAEGIRARVIDKDQAPRWNPARLEDVQDGWVTPFFVSPWPHWAHPLRHLG